MKKYDLSGFQILEFEELDSTNTKAAELLKEGLEDRSVVLTFRQTKGKGQVGNSWESEAGKNICITVVFRPERLQAVRQFAVSMVIALGCRDFIGKYVQGCCVKWPNDVYVGEQKMVGILIEHTVAGPFIRTSLCGIGVNINQQQFYSDAPNPVSLFQLLGKELDIREALKELLDCIRKRYESLSKGTDLERDYLDALYRKCGEYFWEDAAGRFAASLKGVDEYGRLVLKDREGKERVYGFKEVKFC